jgi:hypothetical protein
MKADAIAEGLADYASALEEMDAREQMIRWSAAVVDPCCRECGYLTYAKEELHAARRHARAAGVFDEQPGEADWLAGHRVERPMELDEMYLSVEIGSI